MTEVKLQQKSKFELVLETYKPSHATISALKGIKLGIFIGITGAGKNTIINHLLNNGSYHFLISDTTRPPKVRDGRMEIDGLNYNFISEDAFLEGLEKGEYIEAEIIHGQQVSGANISEILKASNSGKIPINEVEIKGTANLRMYKPDTKFFFIVPPSYSEWMKRLMGREVMNEHERAARIATAILELEEGLKQENFIFIINDSSEKSARMIDEIMHGDRFEEHHEEALATARKILEDIRAHHG